MVLIKAAFTLPGLAGLVLTIGMAVDANVLIYERIREELKSGAALRMAIRNGFSRAMSAIIDSNVTTIITGIVLFYIGTDQVKGFAVTLILGILTSMFTAIFFARLVFDVAERRGWIKHAADDEDPFAAQLTISWACAGSPVGVSLRADRDRHGGRLCPRRAAAGHRLYRRLVRHVHAQTVRTRCRLPRFAPRLIGTELADKNLLIVERGTTNTRYQVDTSEQSVDKVEGSRHEDVRRQVDDVLARIQRSEAVHRRQLYRHRGEVARECGRRICGRKMA